MAITVEKLVSYLESKLHGDRGNSRFTQDVYDSCNEVQAYLMTLRKWGWAVTWDETVTTTASTRYVALPSDFAVLIADDVVRDTDNDTWLERITYRQWRDRWYEDGSSEGNPSKYWLQGQTMYFTPVPDDEYTIEFSYHKGHREMDQSNQEFLIPDYYEPVVKRMVLAEMLERSYGPVQEITLNDAKIQRMIADMIHDDIRRYPDAAFKPKLPRGTRTMRF